MDKQNDELHLLSVPTPPPSASSPFPITQATVGHNEMVHLWKAEKNKTIELLRGYGGECHKRGVGKVWLVVGNGPVGEVVCGYVEGKKVDFLCMGRRGMGKVERFFIGSNSKYCVEEADCNVVIMQHSFGEKVVFRGDEGNKYQIHEFGC